MNTNPLRFIFIIFAAYTFKCGLVAHLGMGNGGALFIAITLATICIAIRPFIFISAVESNSLNKLLFAFFIDLIVIIPAIWGACVAWGWNVLVAILVFCIGAFILG